MTPDQTLKSRHREILHSIVRAYIQTGEPVGSRTISRGRENSLSPATIRNVMADLADEGYLAQPHTSAGRVPTQKAFQLFVSTLDRSPVPASVEAELLRRELSGLETIGARVERSSCILMQLTRNMGIAAAMPALSQELDQIELTPLSENRVLMIVVTRDHMVRNRVVTLEEAATREELGSIRNYVNRHFSGWRLESARRELLRRMLEDRELYDAAMRKLDALCRKGLLEGDAAAPEIYTDGASNLLEIDLHLTRERLRDLMRALEEKRRLIDLLDRFLEQPPGELTVRVGLGDIDPVMQDLSMVGMTVRLPSGQPAKVAVLGPMRMNYECVIAAIQRTSRALENAWF